MANLDKVVGFLRKNVKRWYCNDCISAATGVKPPNQVNQLTRPLRAATSEFQVLEDTPCFSCGKALVCIRALK
jgi:hypothetical protein